MRWCNYNLKRDRMDRNRDDNRNRSLRYEQTQKGKKGIKNYPEKHLHLT